MSTVKIKTEPAAATAATAATVDVKVKLEPSLSTDDINLEQYTSDIDTKVESDLEADSDDGEEGDIKSENDDDSDDEDQNKDTATPQKRRQWICIHLGCGRRFNFSSNLVIHRHEHRLQAEFSINGNMFILARQSLSDRWPCSIPDCKLTYKTVKGVCDHIRACHNKAMKQQQQQQQQPLAHKTRNTFYFVDVDNFYVNGIRCGYHNTIGVFLCHECRLVPECLLSHLQQKHGYGERSIDNSALPESAVNANADPNINQHTSNSHLATAISNPCQLQHPDIVQGWLCVISDCGYCCSTKESRRNHHNREHTSEHTSTVHALVLRLLYGKSQTSYYQIPRLNTAANCDESSNSASQHSSECDDDDGDELVLSDYSYEDDIN